MGQVITVVSGKGGTGKTSFTANVGMALAQMGRRVLCLDCDVGLRNLDIALVMTDRAVMDFTDVLNGRCTLEEGAGEHPAQLLLGHLVEHGTDALLPAVVLYLLAGTAGKRADDSSPHRRDTPQSPDAAPPAKVQKQRLHAVRQGVGGGDFSLFPGTFLKEGIPQLPPGLLHRAPVRPGPGGGVHPLSQKGQAVPLRQLPDESLVPVALLPPQLMVQVADGDLQRHSFSQMVEKIQHGNGICPSGHPGSHRVSPLDHLVFLDRFQGLLVQPLRFSHGAPSPSAIPGCRSGSSPVPARRRCWKSGCTDHPSKGRWSRSPRGGSWLQCTWRR